MSDNFILNVLMACHNRVTFTTRCLTQLEEQAKRLGLVVQVYLVDDGSTDGTFEAASHFEILHNYFRGDGDLFWAKSMEIAEAVALADEDSRKDYGYLWVNDDVDLFGDSLLKLVENFRLKSDSILVGATVDDRNHPSYGGMVKNGIHPLNYSRVGISDRMERVETFNGNFVFMPGYIAHAVGGIDGSFSHGLADIDFGIRANALGIPILQLPGAIGLCNRNIPALHTSRRKAWNEFLSSKGGGNFKSLRRILSKRTIFWPVVILASYSLWWLRRAKPNIEGYVA